MVQRWPKTLPRKQQQNKSEANEIFKNKKDTVKGQWQIHVCGEKPMWICQRDNQTRR